MKNPKAHKIVGEFMIDLFKELNPQFDAERFRKNAKMGKEEE